MQNWEVLQKKVSEMNKDEFIEFISKVGASNVHEIGKMCDIEDICNEVVLCSYDNWKCEDCLKLLLNKEYQPPKKEWWIVHRTLRTKGIETYVGYSDDNVDDGCRKYFLGTFDGKNISGYLLKLKAHKFDYLEAIVLREQLNKQRTYKQYLWVISKVEE